MLIALLVAPLLLPQEGEPNETHLGAYTRTVSELASPVAVDFGKEGELWVVEADLDRVSRFDRFGNRARTLEASNVWRAPAGVAADTRLYVSDPSRRRVVAVGREDWIDVDVVREGPQTLCEPAGVEARAGQFAIADPLGGVVHFNDGKRWQELGRDLLVSPRDVAFDDRGWLFVVDGARARVERFRPDGTHDGGFGDFGAFPGLLAGPSGIDVARDEVFVADTENHRVSVYDRAGRFRYAVGLHAIRPREGEGKLHYPTAVAVTPDGEMLAVAEPLDDRVQLFERAQGTEPPKDPFRALAPQAAPHYGPTVAQDGKWMLLIEPETPAVLLLDTTSDPEPSELTTFGRRGTSLGRYLEPKAATLDLARREAWVCDPYQAIVDRVRLRIDPEAPLNQHLGAAAWIERLHLEALDRQLAGLNTWFDPGPVALARDPEGSDLWTIDARNRLVLQLDAEGACERALGSGLLLHPVDLAFDPEGILWVVDEWAGRVIGFRPETGEVHRILGEELFRRPTGIVIDAEGRMFVSDRAKDRVLRFVGSDRPDLSIGSRGLGPQSLCRPAGLAIDGDGHLVVVDHGNHRGMVFTSEGEFVSAFGSKLYVRPARYPDRYDSQTGEAK